MFNPYDRRLLTDTDADHRARTPPSLGGDDFAYGLGSAVISPGPGVVDLVDRDPGGSGGRMVGVRHANGVRSEQLHLSAFRVEVGDQVDQGERLGDSGGSAYGQEHGVGYHIHCHFVVNGVRWGWLNFLASLGAGTAGWESSLITEDDMFTDQDRADLAESLRLQRLIVLAPTGHASPATDLEVAYVQHVQGLVDNAAESRRMGAVLLGAQSPATGENRPGGASAPGATAGEFLDALADRLRPPAPGV